jgi:hypothetical protein
MAGRAQKRTRNHAAHFRRTAQNIARRLANLIQFPQRDDLFVRRHLEHAVGGRVDDGRARAHVLGAQFLNDLGARGSLVAQRIAADPPLEFLHDLGRKSVRVERKGTVQMDAGHFPVAGGGVFAGRSQGAAAEGALGSHGGRRFRPAV